MTAITDNAPQIIVNESSDSNYSLAISDVTNNSVTAITDNPPQVIVNGSGDSNYSLTLTDVTNDSVRRIPLFLITPSSRISVLTKSIFHVLRLHQCFDVHWIIAHGIPDPRISQTPLFRGVFPWITEIFTYNAKSIKGNHERNTAILHMLNITSHGLVYFLDDDNTVTTDLCDVRANLNLTSEKMYYADLYRCDEAWLLKYKWKDWLRCNETCHDVQLWSYVDTATFLTPISLMKKYGILWNLNVTGSDGVFFTEMVNAIRRDDGNDDRFVALPSSVRMNYNELSTKNGCLEWREPWNVTDLHSRGSLQLYHNMITEMKSVHASLTSNEMMDRDEVTFHDYVHILYDLRYYVSKPAATFVEIGIWKGATSIFMSRHPLETDVFGVDVFTYARQFEEADQYRKRLQGNGTIYWIKSDSADGNAISELKNWLNEREIDIFFIDGDHTTEGVKRDFKLYAPLVSDGGFIVFDDFLDTSSSEGVRVAIMELIRDGLINLEIFDVIGSVENTVGAGRIKDDNNFFYDWQNITSNEFIIRKKNFDMLLG